MSLGAKRCTFGSGRVDQAIREELRRAEQVAQIVVDLGHREPKRGQPALLLQRRGELGLHGGELALGGADLVDAAGRHDDAVGIFRVGAERGHIAGDPPHRPHEQIMQRQIDEGRGDAGDEQRDQQQVDRIAQHRLAQRRLVHNDLDKVAAHRRRADDAHHVIFGVEHHLERIDDRIEA